MNAKLLHTNDLSTYLDALDLKDALELTLGSTTGMSVVGRFHATYASVIADETNGNVVMAYGSLRLAPAGGAYETEALFATL